MKRNLTELNKLEQYLIEHDYEYQRTDQDNVYSAEEWRIMVEVNGAKAKPKDRHQIIVYERGVRSWDVICQRGSLGAEKGLLEGMGDLFGRQEPEGFLTAEDVVKRLEGEVCTR